MIGLLADHIRAESEAEREPLQGAGPCWCPYPQPRIPDLRFQCPRCGSARCRHALGTRLVGVAEERGGGRMTIVEFLLARIGEDLEYWRTMTDDPLMGTIANRYLDEAEAKVRVISEHPVAAAGAGQPYCERCCESEDSEGGEPYPCMTLRALGLVYEGHADYLEEWRP